ncbi:MAG TPA: cupin domain-containing protein [Actinomycetes bacterium]|nr:cupin domain-containing protein [Actinomycetes bacterium]
MTGWVGNIGDVAKASPYFRQVVYTGARMQLVVMTLQPGEDIGLEAHRDVEQLIRVESGRATVTMGPTEHEITEAHDVADGWTVFVPAGTWHNVLNSGGGALRLSSLYGPPEHPEATVHRTKAEARAAEVHHV